VTDEDRDKKNSARRNLLALERAFRRQKASSKNFYHAYIRHLHQHTNHLRWSDPARRAPAWRQSSVGVRIEENSIYPILFSVAFPVRSSSKGCAVVRPHRQQRRS
jgi:hypothetical protein